MAPPRSIPSPPSARADRYKWTSLSPPADLPYADADPRRLPVWVEAVGFAGITFVAVMIVLAAARARGVV